jgi:predicted protein tyrosine phosphatase
LLPDVYANTISSAIQRIIVHCDASVSPSSAVAAALARALNDDDTEFFDG